MLTSSATTAALIFAMFKRSGKTRARISDKTFRLISQRERLHETMIANFRYEVEELGVIAVPLSRGGFGLLLASALEGAVPITAKEFIKSEIASLRKGKLDVKKLLEEFNQTLDDDDFESD